MNTTFVEGYLQFEFADAWTVVKYDETAEYARIRNQTEAKGVDFVGLVVPSVSRFVIQLIEVKDFRGHRIENAPRIRSSELALEVAQKVRDTVAGVVGASRTSTDVQRWQRFAGALRRKRDGVRVVLWVEQDRPHNNGTVSRRSRQMRGKTELSVLAGMLKAKTRWLSAKIFVVDQGTGLEGVTTTNLPGAGRT